METFISTLLAYVAIWAPALVAVLGIATTVILAINKVRAAIKEFKKDDFVKQLAERCERLAASNEELTRTNSLLLDEMAKIKGYADLRRN